MLDAETIRKLKENTALIPEGVHQMKLKKVRLTTSKAGNEMLELDFEQADPWSKKSVRDWAVLREDLLWKVGQIFKAFQADPEETDLDDLVGKTVLVNIVHEVRDGVTYEKIAAYLPDQPDADQAAA